MKQVIIKMENGNSLKQAVAEFATLERLNNLLIGSDVGYGGSRGIVKEVVWA